MRTLKHWKVKVAKNDITGKASEFMHLSTFSCVCMEAMI
jgi:hypothetical protein